MGGGRLRLALQVTQLAQGAHELARDGAAVAQRQAQPVGVGFGAVVEGLGLEAFGAAGLPHGGGEAGGEEAAERGGGRQLGQDAPGQAGEGGVVLGLEHDMDLGAQPVAQRVARRAGLAGLGARAAGAGAVAAGALGALGLLGTLASVGAVGRLRTLGGLAPSALAAGASAARGPGGTRRELGTVHPPSDGSRSLGIIARLARNNTLDRVCQASIGIDDFRLHT